MTAPPPLLALPDPTKRIIDPAGRNDDVWYRWLRAADTVLRTVYSLATGAVPVTRQIISGPGLTGGGDLSADRTLAVGAGAGITVNPDDIEITPTITAGGPIGAADTVPVISYNARGQLTGVGTATITPEAIGALRASVYTAADVLAKLLTVDGTGSGLDADLLDGQSSAYYTDIIARLGYTPEPHSDVLTSITGHGTSPGYLVVLGDGNVDVRTFTAGIGLVAADGSGVGGHTVYSLADTAVAPATYGGPGKRVAFTVDQQGRLTAASEATLAASDVSDFAEAVDDRAAALLQNGAGVSWTYNDVGGTLTPTVTLAPFSTSNLSEGSNLYFTAARVLATVLTGLSLATNAAITAADTVLSALGKLQKQITDHKADTANPHSVTKSQVGLGSADNTADTAKPVSTAQQTALDLKLAKASNLSDLASASTARGNLGLAAVAASGSASDLSTGTLPAARLPNPSASTLGGIQSAAAVSHQWVASISTSGVPALSQPAFSDISGSVAASQMPAQPAFNANRTSSQLAVASATWTKIQANNEVFDTNSNYDPTTNYRFQPTVAGKYLVTGKVVIISLASGSLFACSIYKNGASHKQQDQKNAKASADLVISSITAIVDMNGSSDYLELWCYHDHGSARDIYGDSGVEGLDFSAARLCA